MVDKLKLLHSSVYTELSQNILPYWMNKTVDKEYGGFYGQINGWGDVVRGAEKGGILNSRILWTFSAAFNQLKHSEYLKMAEYSLQYNLNHFFDETHEGVYWKITYDGKPFDTKKQIYSQAFFIYALSEYYKATGNKACLDKAIYLYRLIEKRSFDQVFNGYYEAYSQDWKLLDDLRLSAKDANEKKTTNTHLHILEAYASLYRVWKDKELEHKLRNLVNIFLDQIIDPKSNHLMLFFDEHWNSRSSLISYGHDIEASWLVYDGALALEDKALIEKAKPLCVNLALASLEGLQPDGSLIYEKDDSEGLLDMERHWWPQAETMVGLLNLYELTHVEFHLDQAVNCWEYITHNLIDNEQGEWYWSIKDGEPNLTQDKAGFWKCPYHNGRACLEVMTRCERILKNSGH